MLIAALLGCAADPTPAGPAGEDPPWQGRLERAGDREVLYLWGTRREIGYAEGALTCDRVGALFKSYLLEYLVGEYTEYDYEVAKTLVLGASTFDPADLEELEGYYDGATDWCTDEQLTIESEMFPVGPHRLDLDDLRFANAVGDFGCSSFTVWGAASATGDTLHGRNFDWAIDPEETFLTDHLVKVYDSVDEGGRFASVMVPAMAGCVSCVTEEGVSLTMHNVSGEPADSPVGISPRMPAARAALVSTLGADDPIAAAEATLEARPQLVGNNLHLAMPMARGHGEGGVVLEYDGDSDHPDGRVTVRRAGEDEQEPRTDVTLAANHYAKRRVDLGDDDSNGRIDTLARAIDRGAVRELDAQGLLDAVKNGYSGITAHSIVVDAAARELSVYVAPHADTSATESEPTVFALDELFDHVRELSGR